MWGGVQFAKIKVSICHGERSPNDPAWRGRGEGESNHPENASITHAASGNSLQAFSRYVNAIARQYVAEENVFKRTPCRSMGSNISSGCFDLRLSRLPAPVRRDSRVAQHDRSDFFRLNCYPAASDRGAALAAARITPAKNNVSAK